MNDSSVRVEFFSFIKVHTVLPGSWVHSTPDADGGICGHLRRRAARQGVRALPIRGIISHYSQ